MTVFWMRGMITLLIQQNINFLKLLSKNPTITPQSQPRQEWLPHLRCEEPFLKNQTMAICFPLKEKPVNSIP
ncbi:hypothetical protein DD549_15590 [Shewanella algae]|nr:hypothetical protein DD549_15590 [Shewanella algae]